MGEGRSSPTRRSRAGRRSQSIGICRRGDRCQKRPRQASTMGRRTSFRRRGSEIVSTCLGDDAQGPRRLVLAGTFTYICSLLLPGAISAHVEGCRAHVSRGCILGIGRVYWLGARWIGAESHRYFVVTEERECTSNVGFEFVLSGDILGHEAGSCHGMSASSVPLVLAIILVLLL